MLLSLEAVAGGTEISSFRRQNIEYIMAVNNYFLILQLALQQCRFELHESSYT